MSDPSDMDDLPTMHFKRQRSRSWTSFLFYNVLRISIWYLVITLVFRCPTHSVNITSSSPRVCQSYVDLRARIDPFAKPYFDKYAAPYVAVVRPYAEIVKSKILTPAISLSITNYEKHAAPHVAQAKKFGESGWQRTIKPQVKKVEEAAFSQYKANVEPLVINVEKAVHPHVQNARTAALWQYEHTILPWYRKILPQLQDLYILSGRVAMETIIPRAKVLASTSSRFVVKRIWPTIRIAYGRNVEPQLSKIKERLGSYTDSKKLESEIENMDQRYEQSEQSVSDSDYTYSRSSSLSHIVTESSTSTATDATPQATVQESIRPLVDELKLWQEKFARASDKGAEDLFERITEITARHIHSQGKGLGQAHLTRLEEVSHTALDNLKKAIIRTVKRLENQDDGSDRVQEAYEEGKEHVRKAARVIKEEAQTLRLWRLEFIDELDTLVNAATASTLEVLDHVRNLGLQEIGLRWAKLDDLVTHQDWTEYHSLKNSFTEWRKHVEQVSSGHEGLIEAQRMSEEMEEQGMAIAEDAANELSRLKDVVEWKIELLDSTDDFSTRAMPLKAPKMGQKILEKASEVSEAFVGTSTTEDSVQSAFSEASKVLLDTFDKTVVEAFEQVQALTSNILPAAKEVVSQSAESKSQSISDEAESTLTETSGSLSTATSTLGSAYQSAIEFVDEAPTAASSVTADRASYDPYNEDENLLSSVVSYGSQASSVASEAINVKDESTSSSTTTSTVTYTISLESPTGNENPEATVDIVSDTLDFVEDASSPEKVSEAIKEAIEMVIQSSASAASAASTVGENIVSAAGSEASIASSVASEQSDNIAAAATSGVSKASNLGESGKDSLSSKTKKRRSSNASAKSKVSEAAKSGSSYASAKAQTLSSDIIDGTYSASKSIESKLSEAKESTSSTTKSLRMLADLD